MGAAGGGAKRCRYLFSLWQHDNLKISRGNDELKEITSPGDELLLIYELGTRLYVTSSKCILDGKVLPPEINLCKNSFYSNDLLLQNSIIHFQAKLYLLFMLI
jgi:hypothetical protein